MKNNLGNAMSELVLGDDDDDGEAAVMEDSDLEDEEDEVSILGFWTIQKNFKFYLSFVGRSQTNL